MKPVIIELYNNDS